MKEAFRILGIVFSLLFMAGFGMCGAWGLILGFAPSGYGALFIVCGLVGLGIACVFWFPLRALLRQGKPPRDDP